MDESRSHAAGKKVGPSLAPLKNKSKDNHNVFPESWQVSIGPQTPFVDHCVLVASSQGAGILKHDKAATDRDFMSPIVYH